MNAPSLTLEPILLGHRTHQKIRNKPHHHKASHDVQDQRVGLLSRQMVGDVMVEDAIDDKWPHDSRGGPGRQEAPVNSAHLVAAKKIFKIRRNSREPATVHAQQHTGGQYKQRDRMQSIRRKRKSKVQQHANDKKDEVGGFSSDEV